MGRSAMLQSSNKLSIRSPTALKQNMSVMCVSIFGFAAKGRSFLSLRRNLYFRLEAEEDSSAFYILLGAKLFNRELCLEKKALIEFALQYRRLASSIVSGDFNVISFKEQNLLIHDSLGK